MSEEKANNKQKPRQGFLFPAMLLLLIISGAVYAIDRYMPNFKKVPFYEYFGELDSERQYILLMDKRLVEGPAPILVNGEPYLPVDFIKEYIDPYVFWDGGANRLTITTGSEVKYITADKLGYTVNNEPAQLELPILNIDGTGYLPAIMLMREYNIACSHESEYGSVVVDYRSETKLIGEVTAKKAVIRYEPDIKSPIAAELAAGTQLVLFGEADGFLKVRTADGLIGYIAAKNIEETAIIPAEYKDEQKVDLPPLSEKIVLVWDLITNPTANGNPSRRILHEGVNVLSPTWFEFNEENPAAGVVSIADKDYVNWAHSNGIMVWGLVSDNYSASVCHAVLADTAAREAVILQLLELAAEYELDGINIDFEQITPADEPFFRQFLRELKPLATLAGLYLSVDLYVPTYTGYIKRAEIAKTVDYVCVMTYDEHTYGSPVSGPVASIGFVDDGITATLREVPSEKVLMGLPFYVRVWREGVKDGAFDLSFNSYDMEYGYEIFTNRNAEFIWQEALGCYYAEYTVDENGSGATYKVWLEDERSIEEKLKLFKKFGLAGVACWRRGLEKDAIWPLIKGYAADN